MKYNHVSTFNKPLALITGASSGIGYELAKIFAQNGYDLVVTALDSGIAEASNTFRSLGGQVEYVQVDLSRPEGADELYGFITALGRPLAVAALNAGAGVGGDFTRETDIKDELRIINLNVISTVLMAKKILKDMVSRGEGKILFTSSVVGVMPSPLQAVYAATKAFVQSFAEAVRNELQDTKVTITALMPGATETKFFEGPGLPGTKVANMKKDDPADVAKDGFEALMDGKDHVVAGSFMNKLHVFVNKFLSEETKAVAPRKYAEPVKQDDLSPEN